MKAFAFISIPPNAFTVPVIAPAACSGVVMVKDVLVLSEIGIEMPSTNSSAPQRFVPVMVTTVPPLVGPELGEMEVMVGALNVKVNAFDLITDPLAVVSVALMDPNACAEVVILNEFAVLLDTGTKFPSTITLAPLRFVPVIVITVPPQAGPEVGLMEVMVGTAPTTYVNVPDLVAVPPAVVTATLLAPTVPAGVVAVMEVALTTTTLVAKAPPIFTLVAPVKLVPVMVIVVPPVVGPEVGLTFVIVGSGVMYVNALALVAVPPAVVTATLLAPVVPAGVLAVTEVLDITAMFVASMPPTVTLVAPVKLVPTTVMVVPPVVGPEVGLTLRMVGSGRM